ncbi:MAG: hypothetical protein A3F95_02490 [Candidatus Nealsonbacteria bacterium RIFCSPLOWO2_12_FULL_39_31]|uniref:Pilus assembly protein PilO n=2 Tax=Candidatus Nealsoniibacteriota TaxID=1817911 RepID=A0A1G2EHZ3_9BACT|nr:MAG: hypothetical protein UT22_C0031G0009 [Parcubacteria group bacterium GW2011_GWC2_39_11]OGZ20519.1 MAG: hypothetical protein A2W55_01750 [Candidatus Nealsonbacteria bacterium RIFCSPHIGHO2_02_38_10]OGZ21425.1 MAG: hypothetical protein A3C48_01585 [Candidatus Nealsonbacteria bacterium RIFCSPHIGHO2_02_FULL_38_75]OGZ23029.1 MAG: hypothetical protein A2981_03240 [Candidatus Nealsonbacteria bacterium RIFCSPLOWO2_01_FULL_38_120]OGZ24858.1 MAG: hypothetical protein A2W71_02895 [Candidatus Nealson
MNNRLIPIISVLLLIVLAVSAYIFWWPLYQKFNLMKNQFETKESDLAQKEQYLADMKLVLKKISIDYKDEIERVNSVLPSNISIPSLFNYMLKTSSESGLILEDIGWPQSSPLNDIQKVSFSVTLSGTYGAFKNFLSALYKSGRLIETESISLYSDEKGGAFRFLLSLSAYGYYMEPTAERMP